MSSPNNAHSRQFTDLGPAGECQDPWEAVAQLRNLVSLTREIAHALPRWLRLRDGLGACANVLVHGLDAAFARIWTLNEKENVLELQASAGLYTHLDGPHSRIPVGHLKIGLIAQECKPQLTNAVIGDPRIDNQEWARREGMIAFCGYPLFVAGRVIGVMALFARHPLTSQALQVLATVADSIAHGINHWRAVEALRDSQERFDLMIRGTDQGIWDWNILTDEIYMTPRFKEMLGYEEHQFESSYAMWKSRLHPEDRDQAMQALWQHLEQRQPYRVDYRLRTNSGEYRWFHARGQALWDGDGRAFRMVGSIVDITAQKCSQERLETIHQINQILAERTDLTEALARILQAVCAKFHWKVGEFWVRDKHADVLRLEAFTHLPSVSVPRFHAAAQQLSFARGIGLPGRTWASERPEWIDDVVRDANFLRAAEAAQDGLHGGIALPILIRDTIHGVMVFFHHEIPKPDEDLLKVLGNISSDISRCIDLQQEQQKVRHHQHELAIAQAIQRRMFPVVMPVLEGFEIAGASQPTSAVGGDYFDFIARPNGHLMLVLGDVSGHGLGPALVAATARAYLRIMALTNITIDRIRDLANIRLVADTNEEFMTLFLGLIDPSSRSLLYCNAGHCPGIIIDPRGEVRTSLASSDLPLGVDSHHNYQKSAAVQLLPGDLLLLVSDGVGDAFAPDREAFGMARILDTVRASRSLPPAEIIVTLFGAVREFAQVAPHDDMTAIVVKVNEGGSCGASGAGPP
jgi:PAS domain S-box-containing protein